ncbi:F-box only protein 21-like [Clavelina lepadiformis]|uniref:Hemimethylated DNA-binding domain-containing protein n=1 Tax=Clavelina lepadiformis TaxID=159417 RepID=A0ABP0GR32_CLALP
MAALVNLPDSVLLDMLTCGCLNAKDILQFGLTCSRFHTLTSSNIIWKKLCDQTWPGLLKKDDSFFKVLNTLTVSLCGKWKIIYQQINKVITQVWNLYENHFIDDQIDDEVFIVFECFVKNYTYSFVRELLLAICEENCQFSDLTLIYYCKEVLRHITCSHIASELKQILDHDHEGNECSEHAEDTRPLSSLMSGVLLIDKWFNFDRNISKASIANFIGTNAGKVLSHFKTVKSSTDKNELEADLLMKSLKKVFFYDLGFCGNVGDHYCLTNSFLHHVIKSRKDIPIFLSIVCREIASNIGIKLDCINYPQHFLLRWERETKLADKDFSCYRFIDVSNGFEVKTYSEITAGVRDVNILTGPGATTYEVLCCICRNIQLFANATGHSYPTWLKLHLLNLCIHLMPDEHEAAKNKLLSKNDEMKEAKEIVYSRIYLRTSEANEGMKYSIGMIMKDRFDHDTCVINGWDNFCLISEEWIPHMHVNECKEKRLFYQVLANNGIRYAPEDLLTPVRCSEKVEHKEMGRYFSKFVTDGNYSYYTPNSQLALRYPQDSDATRDFYLGNRF